MVARSSYSFLSTLHFALHPSGLSLHSHVFAICGRGFEETWTFEGFVVGCSPFVALSSVGWEWL